MLKVSHIQYKVNDIKKAVKEFEEACFTVMWGRDPKHADNAFVWFEEGPFIEIFEMKKKYSYFAPIMAVMYGKEAKQRWKHWYEVPEGWCDFALEAEDGIQADMGRINEIQAYVNGKGVATSKIINGNRTRPDGEKVRYAYFTSVPTELPFVVSTYQPRQRPETIVHKNGAVRVAELKVTAPEKLTKTIHALAGQDRVLTIGGISEQKRLSVTLEFDRRIKPQGLIGKIFEIKM